MTSKISAHYHDYKVHPTSAFRADLLYCALCGQPIPIEILPVARPALRGIYTTAFYPSEHNSVSYAAGALKGSRRMNKHDAEAQRVEATTRDLSEQVDLANEIIDEIIAEERQLELESLDREILAEEMGGGGPLPPNTYTVFEE